MKISNPSGSSRGQQFLDRVAKRHLSVRLVVSTGPNRIGARQPEVDPHLHSRTPTPQLANPFDGKRNGFEERA